MVGVARVGRDAGDAWDRRAQGQMEATMIAATASWEAAVTRLAGWKRTSVTTAPSRPGVIRSSTTNAAACRSTPRMPNTTV